MVMAFATQPLQFRFRGHSILVPDPPDHDPAKSMLDEVDVRERHWLLDPGERVIDVGAGFGSYTLTALCQGAHVIAFEPVHREWSVLNRALQLNAKQPWAQDWGECILLRRALGSGEGYPRALLDQLTPCPMELRNPSVYSSLDEVVHEEEIDQIDAIKIDVEGGELEVLRGAYATLEEMRPRLLIEDHSNVYPWCREQDTRGQIEQLLEPLYDLAEEAEGSRAILIGTPR